MKRHAFFLDYITLILKIKYPQVHLSYETPIRSNYSFKLIFLSITQNIIFLKFSR